MFRGRAAATHGSADIRAAAPREVEHVGLSGEEESVKVHVRHQRRAPPDAIRERRNNHGAPFIWQDCTPGFIETQAALHSTCIRVCRSAPDAAGRLSPALLQEGRKAVPFTVRAAISLCAGLCANGRPASGTLPINLVPGRPRWTTQASDPGSFATPYEIRVSLNTLRDGDISLTYPDSMVSVLPAAERNPQSYEPESHGESSRPAPTRSRRSTLGQRRVRVSGPLSASVSLPALRLLRRRR